MMRDEQGSSLLGVVAMGSLVIVLVVQGLLAAGRVQVAAELAAEAAGRAASWGARLGDVDATAQLAEAIAPGSRVTVYTEGGRLVVEVVIDVALIGPEGASITRSVTGQAASPISPYRSRRG